MSIRIYQPARFDAVKISVKSNAVNYLTRSMALLSRPFQPGITISKTGAQRTQRTTTNTTELKLSLCSLWSVVFVVLLSLR